MTYVGDKEYPLGVAQGYTFPAYRGHRNAGKLIAHICEVLKSAGNEKVYISTNEIGLYEKYGFTFWQTMPNREGKTTRVYVKNISR